jgi:hypothetical protein
MPNLLRSLFRLVAVLSLIAPGLLQAKPDNPSISASINGQASIPLGDSGMISVSAGISFGDARQLAVNHGMTGTKPLPKGIRKNLERGKPMPPGIANTRMPGSFVNQLPDHEGYEWRQAGSDLLLVASGSLVIADVLENVFD